MRRILAVALLFTFSPALIAAPFDEMDYGPFLSHTFQLPNGNTTLRGIAVPFDAPLPDEDAKAGKCGVIFDTELLRYSGYWNGGFITWKGVVFDGNHGQNPGPAGKLVFATAMTAGVGIDNEKLVDPRGYPHGPMPREVGRYKGLYRTDKGVIFAYTIGATNVLDMPSVEVHNKQRVLVRTLNLEPSRGPRYIVLADLPKAKKMVNVGEMMLLDDGQNAIVTNVVGAPKGTELVAGTRMVLRVPGTAKPIQLRVGLWGGSNADWEAGAKALEGIGNPTDLMQHTKECKARFTETVTTQGKRGDDKGAYTVDSLTPPFKNPYKSWMRFGGFDFFSDGRAAVSTWSGDVWIVSGIDDGLQNLKWNATLPACSMPLA